MSIVIKSGMPTGVQGDSVLLNAEWNLGHFQLLTVKDVIRPSSRRIGDRSIVLADVLLSQTTPAFQKEVAFESFIAASVEKN